IDRTDYRVDGDSVWICGRQPALLRLGLDGTVHGWWDLSRFVAEDHLYAGVRMCPSRRIIWVLAVERMEDAVHGNQRMFGHVVDLDRGEVVRHLVDVRMPDVVD